MSYFSSAGGGATGGAATGALIGTGIAPGIGTAIGAGVGGLAGLFGGLFKEKEKQSNIASAETDFQNMMNYAETNKPKYQQVLNEQGTGFSDPNSFQVQNTYDPYYMQQYSNYAYDPNKSTWLQMMENQIGEQGVANREAAGQQVSSGVQGAMDALAMKRGLTTGAGERLAGQGSLAQMMENQRIARETQAKIGEANITEQANKLQAMGQLPGMELGRAQQAAGIGQTNIGTLMAERANQQKALQDAYNTKMQAWAAGQQGLNMLKYS
jgi:hypothetical protein